MPLPHHGAPDRARHGDLIILADRGIGIGQLADPFAIEQPAPAHMVQEALGRIAQGILVEIGGKRALWRVRQDQAGLEPFDPAHMEGRAGARRKPAGQPHMVGMEMGDEQPGDWRALQQRIGEHGFEQGAGGGVIHPAIDQRPSLLGSKEPGIHLTRGNAARFECAALPRQLREPRRVSTLSAIF